MYNLFAAFVIGVVSGLVTFLLIFLATYYHTYVQGDKDAEKEFFYSIRGGLTFGLWK